MQDRTIYEDSVFGTHICFTFIYSLFLLAKVLYKQGYMELRDYQTYCSLFANMSNFMVINLSSSLANNKSLNHFKKKPNLIIHLDVTPEESMERIKSRYFLMVDDASHSSA